MSITKPLPLKFQIGARTLASIRRDLVRVSIDLNGAVDGDLPDLPPLDPAADGYLFTSLPMRHVPILTFAAGEMVAFDRQHYTRRYADLTLGFDAYLERLSSNTRSGIKRKAKKVAAASGGTLDVRRFSTPEELRDFHGVARSLAMATYQEKLMGAGLPDTPDFIQRMYAMAAEGRVRAWLLYVGGEPAAYLYCPIHGGTVVYEFVGHDPKFNDLSVGAVLQVEALRDLFGEAGLMRFDFTEGDGQHKRQFATNGVECVDLLLLRATLANRVTLKALAGFDGTMALAKRMVERFGLQDVARKVRRSS